MRLSKISASSESSIYNPSINTYKKRKLVMRLRRIRKTWAGNIRENIRKAVPILAEQKRREERCFFSSRPFSPHSFLTLRSSSLPLLLISHCACLLGFWPFVSRFLEEKEGRKKEVYSLDHPLVGWFVCLLICTKDQDENHDQEKKVALMRRVTFDVD